MGGLVALSEERRGRALPGREGPDSGIRASASGGEGGGGGGGGGVQGPAGKADCGHPRRRDGVSRFRKRGGKGLSSKPSFVTTSSLTLLHQPDCLAPKRAVTPYLTTPTKESQTRLV